MWNNSLGWIDNTKGSREAALKLIEENRKKNAIDELGLGLIRDLFSDKFFPGTSTIQTRARYFLLVPYLLDENVLSSKNLSKKNVRELVDLYRNSELELSTKIFNRNNEEPGLIGKDILKDNQGTKKNWLVRTIDQIYWNGIRTYGLLKTTYRYSFYQFIKIAKSNNELDNLDICSRKDKNDEECKDESISKINAEIDPGIIEVEKSRFKNEEYNLDLTKQEAEYLKKKITEYTTGTLMSFIVSKSLDVSDNEFDEVFIDKLQKEGLDNTIIENLRLALKFQRYANFIGECYNDILYGKSISFEKFECCDDLVEGLTKLFGRLLSGNTPIHFISDSIEKINAKDADGLKELLIKREQSLKRNEYRCKLKHPEEYIKKEYKVNFKYDFRLSNAKVIFEDLRKSL